MANAQPGSADGSSPDGTSPAPSDPAAPPQNAAVAPNASPPTYQFALRDMLFVTCVAAGAWSLVRARGAGALVLAGGLILSWLNVRGALAPVQTRPARPWLFRASWALFGISLLLPVIYIGGSAPMYGWQAAQATWQVEWGILTDQASPNRPSPEPAAAYWLVWYSSLNLCNLLMVLSPWYCWRLNRDRGDVYAALLALAVVGAWFVPFAFPGLLVGYYVWCLSLTCLACARRPSYRALLLACCFGAVLVVPALLFPKMDW